MVTDAGKHAPNQVLGPPIAHSTGICGTQGTVLRHGRQEPDAHSRDRGPKYPDI